MTDDFSRAHQAITLKAAKNGGPSPGDILDLMFASHNDAEKRDAALEAELKRIVSHLESEAGAINRAITAHGADVNAHGRAPRRKDDPPGYDYSGIPPREDELVGDMKRGWRVGKWAAMTVAVALMAFGLSYWADSCSRSHYWGTEMPIVAPTVTVTATPIP